MIALTLANTIFLNDAQKQIASILPEASSDQIKSAISGRGSPFTRSLSEELQRQTLQGVVVAISKTYLLCITAGSLVLLLAFGLKWERVFLVM